MDLRGRGRTGPSEGRDLGQPPATTVPDSQDQPDDAASAANIAETSEPLVESIFQAGDGVKKERHVWRNMRRAFARTFNRANFVRVMHAIYGVPPARVVQGRSPWYALHRQLYWWLYVLLRLYKPAQLAWLPCPRPSSRVRLRRAKMRIQRVVIFGRKTFSVFSRKGGVGKTTLSKASAGRIKHHRQEWQVIVQDNNPDSGTLALRGRTTTNLALEHLVNAAESGLVHSATDYLRHGNVMEEGYYLIASNPPGDYKGKFTLTVRAFKLLHALSGRFAQIHVYDCGTDSRRGTNVRALVEGDVIKLVTTPARDSLEQTTGAFVWMCGHPQIGIKHVILEVNRHFWWRNLDRIQDRFERMAAAQFAKEGNTTWRPRSFHVMGVGWDPRLQLGLNFTSRSMRSSVRADLDEVDALALELVADAFVGDDYADLPQSHLIWDRAAHTVSMEAMVARAAAEANADAPRHATTTEGT